MLGAIFKMYLRAEHGKVISKKFQFSRPCLAQTPKKFLDDAFGGNFFTRYRIFFDEGGGWWLECCKIML
jgi:hypothetical protein